MARKFWQVAGTDNFAEVKADLKAVRRQLNLDAGVDEKLPAEDEKFVPAAAWPFKIIKGPEHPHNSPFFREVGIGQVFSISYQLYRKNAPGLSIRLGADGLPSAPTPVEINAEQQVILR